MRGGRGGISNLEQWEIISLLGKVNWKLVFMAPLRGVLKGV